MSCKDNTQILIDDYSYNPQHRTSLSSSAVGNILQKYFQENKHEIINKLRGIFSFQENYFEIPDNEDELRPLIPYWSNLFIPPADGMSLYAFVVQNRPRRFIECGSGNSTKFVAKAISDHNLTTKIISIDPFPRAEVDTLCEKIYRIPFENMDVNIFQTMTKDDMLFIDNSHRAFPNSDVTVFFTEVLPLLPSGLLFGLHDIFLPYDYPEVWTVNERRFYNEQYLLASYLIGGAMGDSIEYPTAFLYSCPEFVEILQSIYGLLPAEHKNPVFTHGGGIFWMRKH